MAEDSPQKPPASTGRAAVFARRATSTLVLWGLIAAAIAFQSTLLISILVVAIGTLGAIEFYGLLGLGGVRGWSGVRLLATLAAAGYLAGVALALHGSGAVGPIDAGGLAAVMFFTTVALLFHPVDGDHTKDMFFGSVFGFVYTAVLGSFFLRLLYVGSEPGSGEMGGMFYFLFLLVVTKFADMGAYVVGTAIGKNKMIPHISPGKTWEGFLFGCLPVAVGGGCGVYALFGDQMPLVNWPHVIVLGFGLALVAVVGDLAESVLKRCLAKKDSGNVLPGIGGVLDLIDSLLFTAPALYFYLMLLGGN